MSRFACLLLLSHVISFVRSFGVLSYHRRYVGAYRLQQLLLSNSLENEQKNTEIDEETKMKVGNLVADDEWEGFSMELTELVRVAVLEDVKKNTRDFLGKDEYKIGDISKTFDQRVKDEVARFRNKDEYELGDLSLALDELVHCCEVVDSSLAFDKSEVPSCLLFRKQVLYRNIDFSAADELIALVV